MVVPIRNYPLIVRPQRPRETVVFLDAEKPDALVSGWLGAASGNSYMQIVVGTQGDGILHLVRADGSIDSLRLEAEGLALCQGGTGQYPAPCSLFRPPAEILSQLRHIDEHDAPERGIERMRSKTMPTSSGQRVADCYFELSPKMRAAIRAVDLRKCEGAVPDAASAGLVRIGTDQTGRAFFEGAARCLTAQLLEQKSHLLCEWCSLDAGASDAGSAAHDIATTVGTIATDPKGVQAQMLADKKMRAKVDWLHEQGYLSEKQYDAVSDIPLRMRVASWLGSLKTLLE